MGRERGRGAVAISVVSVKCARANGAPRRARRAGAGTNHAPRDERRDADLSSSAHKRRKHRRRQCSRLPLRAYDYRVTMRQVTMSHRTGPREKEKEKEKKVETRSFGCRGCSSRAREPGSRNNPNVLPSRFSRCVGGFYSSCPESKFLRLVEVRVDGNTRIASIWLLSQIAAARCTLIPRSCRSTSKPLRKLR